MHQLFVSAAALLATAAGPPTDCDWKLFSFKIRIMQADEAGMSECLSQPRMRGRPRQQLECMVGQSVMVGGREVEIGYRSRAVAESAAGGKIRVKVGVEIIELVGGNVRTRKVEAVRLAEPGKAFRLGIEGGAWIVVEAHEHLTPPGGRESGDD
jgi:hypothetical protein